MKKLMMFAAAMTIVGSAFAEVAAYDYKATIKNVNLKSTTVRINGVSTRVYVKFIQSTSLYGYLVTDCDDCNTQQGTGYGYLVVANKSGTGAKVPKILPADLLVKVWNPKVNATTTFEAEGYLFAGKGKADWPYGAPGSWDSGTDYLYNFGLDALVGGATTRFMFGTFNDFERGVDVTGAPTLTFFDTWLDASGFGKAKTDSSDGGCGTGTNCTALDSLSGTLIGGLFLCFPNGEPFGGFENFLCNVWLGTTDVITGTWSIKRNIRLAPVALTATEQASPVLAGGLDAAGLAGATVDSFIKAAAQAIKPGYSFVDTAVAPAKQNGLVNTLFDTAFGLQP